MKHPVVAIGLDSADPVLLERWMSQGHLKNLRQFQQQGAYGRLVNMEYYKGESAWTNFLTGCLPHKTGYWSKFKFNPQTYGASKIGAYGAYDYAEYPPFYAVGSDYRVAMFDMPQTALSDQVNGVQVLAWGAHAPMVAPASQPQGLREELIAKYGDYPIDVLHHQDRSDWYNSDSVAHLQQALTDGIKRRTAITRDLLGRETWDLFLTDIGEPHTAQHYLWHLSQPDHPLYQPSATDPLLDVFETIDQSLAAILAEAPKDAYVLIFSVHGMGTNSADLLSMVMLPEFLYRFSFPGRAMLKSQAMGAPLSEAIAPHKSEHWYKQIHQLKDDPDPVAQLFRALEPILPTRLLMKVYKQIAKLRGSAQTNLYDWHPALWYKPFWPQMKAFYLPGFSDGYIRINVEGRESHGVVPLAEYDAVCDQLIKELKQLTDPRTGKPVVKGIVRTRQNPLDPDPKLPDADLAVMWEDAAVDTVDSPTYGRFGPVFYNRSGAHRARGFVMAQGPGIEPGSNLMQGHVVDLAPTILQLMGAPIPQHLDGKPLEYADGKPLVNLPVIR